MRGKRDQLENLNLAKLPLDEIECLRWYAFSRPARLMKYTAGYALKESMRNKMQWLEMTRKIQPISILYSSHSFKLKALLHREGPTGHPLPHHPTTLARRAAGGPGEF